MKSVFVLIVVLNHAILEVGSSFLHTEIEDDMETEVSDWSDAITDGTVRSLSFVVGIDSSLTRYYNYDEERIQAATVTLFHTVIQYFYPVNIRMTIVDILPVKGVKIGLDDFISWKKEQSNLVEHDITILLRHNYEGGIANGNGLCTKESLIVSGFFPEATMNNAWVLIHQLAHVIGLTHKITTKCKCKGKDQQKCLKIRGFPKCSVQEMLDKLAKKKCFMDNILNSTIDEITSPVFSLPICGNGLLEKDEECDCGPYKFCDNPLCDATKCKFVMEKRWLTMLIPGLTATLLFLVFLCVWKYGVMKLYQFLKSKFSDWTKTTDEREPGMPTESQNTTETLTSLTSPPATVVRMREPRNYETEDTQERRRTRFSDIYVRMRPISRFWEKFGAQSKAPNPIV